MNMDQPLFLIYGKGFIGTLLRDLLEEQGQKYEVANSRMENRESVVKEIEKIRPTHILLAAGVTGTPSVDWCEDHKIETVRGNVIGVLNLIDVCQIYGLHVTFYSSGCIYHYDKEHPEGSKKGFKETDPINYTGSFYSQTKSATEEICKVYPNVLTLRIRLPISADLSNSRKNLITKIQVYQKVSSVENSITVLPELLPMSIEMAKKRTTGIINFTNPGCITNNEILEMYREYIDPDFEWENFTFEEQSATLKAPRCNAFLDTTKLEEMFPSILPVRESIKKYVFEPAQSQKLQIIKAVGLHRKKWRHPEQVPL